MAMSAELRVSSQEVLLKSGDMKNIRTRLSGIMQDMKAKFQSLNTSWDSEAATTYLTQFNKIHKDIEEMLKIVDEYTRDLDEVARIYQTTESKVGDDSAALPGGVFGTG